MIVSPTCISVFHFNHVSEDLKLHFSEEWRRSQSAIRDLEILRDCWRNPTLRKFWRCEKFSILGKISSLRKFPTLRKIFKFWRFPTLRKISRLRKFLTLRKISKFWRFPTLRKISRFWKFPILKKISTFAKSSVLRRKVRRDTSSGLRFRLRNDAFQVRSRGTHESWRFGKLESALRGDEHSRPHSGD